jgi:hypothetical protein
VARYDVTQDHSKCRCHEGDLIVADVGVADMGDEDVVTVGR